jgi:hypothetical protein
VGLRALVFFFAIGFGVLVAYFGVAIIRAELARGHEKRWALLFACGLPLLLVGLIIFAAMAIIQGNILLNLLRGERLLVGERALQRLTRGGRVLSHIPYDAIDRVRVLDVKEQRGMHQVAVRKVLIALRDEDAAGIVLGTSTSFTPGKRRGEYYVEPVFQASPDEIGQALIKRWRAYRERPERDQGEGSEYPSG